MVIVVLVDIGGYGDRLLVVVVLVNLKWQCFQHNMKGFNCMCVRACAVGVRYKTMI